MQLATLKKPEMPKQKVARISWVLRFRVFGQGFWDLGFCGLFSPPKHPHLGSCVLISSEGLRGLKPSTLNFKPSMPPKA